MKKVDGMEYFKSTRTGKKLMVLVDGKWIHFGDSQMAHFKDRTGIWKHLDHKDSKRRQNYLARAKGIRNSEGQRTWTNPSSPNYHSIRVLW
jgi:hypothetical protein